MSVEEASQPGRAQGGGVAVLVTGVVGLAAVITGIVIASLVDSVDELQILAVMLTVAGVLVWMAIPVVREVVLTSIRHPTKDSPIRSPSVTTVVRQSRDRS